MGSRENSWLSDANHRTMKALASMYDTRYNIGNPRFEEQKFPSAYMCQVAGKVNCRAAPFRLNKNASVSNANIFEGPTYLKLLRSP